MRSHKKYIFLLFAFALVVAACSPSGTASTTTAGAAATPTTEKEAAPPTTAGDAGTTTTAEPAMEAVIPAATCAEAGDLRVGIWADSYQPFIDDAAAAWISKYCPGATVTVEPTPWGDYWDALQISAAGGGDLPDVLWMSPVFMPFYQGVGVTADLTNYFEGAGIDPAIWGALASPFTFDGNIYGAPINWDTVAVVYNKELFDQAGLTYPTDDWTWDDFKAAAEAISALGDDIFGGAGYAGFQQGWGSWVANNGVVPALSDDRARCTLTDDGSIEAFAFFKDLVDRGVAPSPNDAGGVNDGDFLALFGEGRLGMTGMGSWVIGDALANYDFDFDVVRMPTKDGGGGSRAISNAIAWVVNSGTDLPELSANFVQFFSSDEGSKFWVDNQAFAPANPAEELQQGWLDRFVDSGVRVQVYVDALAENPQAINPYGSEMWDAVNGEITTRIFTNGEDIAAATAAVCQTVDAVVAG